MKQPGRCQKCGGKAEAKSIDKWLCRRCFTRLIEERIKHNLRQYDIRKDAKIYARDAACKYIISKVINRPVEIVAARQKAEWTAEPWTLDHENAAFLDRLFKGKSLSARAEHRERVMKLFLPATIDEMKHYFKTKNVKYNAEKTPLMKTLDKMEEKYAGLKASLMRSHEKIIELGTR